MEVTEVPKFSVIKTAWCTENYTELVFFTMSLTQGREGAVGRTASSQILTHLP